MNTVVFLDHGAVAETVGLRTEAVAAAEPVAKRRYEALLRSGTPPDPSLLAGYEYRGWNTPFFASLAGIKKFKKGFFTGGRDSRQS